MRLFSFLLLFFCVAVICSCRKTSTDVDIKTYDQQQIQAYMSANGLTGFKRDLSGGDTTGIYYQIISQGTGSVIDYPTTVAAVFTLKSFDGNFVATDTILNHVYNYVGHLTANNLPVSLQAVFVNILKNKGTRARVLLPSHLAYGANGHAFSGGAANTIKGNQCLDYYIEVVNDDVVTVAGRTVNKMDAYDDLSVTNYLTANSLTGFTKTASGLWYQITQTAAGQVPLATSIVTAQYTASLFDGTVTTESYTATNGTGISVDLANDTRKGLIEGLKLVTPGSKITLVMPSRLAFGTAAFYDASIPVFSCLRYDVTSISVQ